jgi:hypothetical protein
MVVSVCSSRPLAHQLVVLCDRGVGRSPQPHSIRLAVLESGLPIFVIQASTAFSVLLPLGVPQCALGNLAFFTALCAHDAITPIPGSVVYVEDGVLSNGLTNGKSGAPRFVGYGAIAHFGCSCLFGEPFISGRRGALRFPALPG